MGKEEIKKLAKKYVNSLTDREHYLMFSMWKCLNKHTPMNPDTDPENMEEETETLPLKREKIENEIRKNCKNESETEKAIETFWEEVDEIFKREPIIETTVEVLGATHEIQRKGLS